MNEILAQAQAQWAAVSHECGTEVAEAEARLDEAKAAAKRNAEELKRSTAKAAAALGRQLKQGNEAYVVETFSFGPDPDAASEPATGPAPPQAPVPSPPAARRRPARAGDAVDDDDEGPRIFREDSW